MIVKDDTSIAPGTATSSCRIHLGFAHFSDISAIIASLSSLLSNWREISIICLGGSNAMPISRYKKEVQSVISFLYGVFGERPRVHQTCRKGT